MTGSQWEELSLYLYHVCMLRTPVFENKICKICIAKYANFILFLSSLLISEGLFFDYEPEFRVSGTTPEWKMKPIQEIKLTDLRRYLPSKRRQMFLVPACFSFEGPPLRTNWKPQPCHERAYNHKSSRKSLELSGRLNHKTQHLYCIEFL